MGEFEQQASDMLFNTRGDGVGVMGHGEEFLAEGEIVVEVCGKGIEDDGHDAALGATGKKTGSMMPR